MKFDQAKSDVRFAANFSSSSFLAATALIFILSRVIGAGAELLHKCTTVPFFSSSNAYLPYVPTPISLLDD